MHIIHMLFRKNKRKRQHNRRGISSIFGVIIGVSILITVIMPAQLYIRQVDSYYERQLKDGQKELLVIISLFKRPVETKSFITLLGKMKSLKNTPLAKANASCIANPNPILT